MSGDDVYALQQYLTSYDTGPAVQKLLAHGWTHYFGRLTYTALVEYQKMRGISPASGYFGPITRGFVNTRK